MLPSMWQRPWEALSHLVILMAVIVQYLMIDMKELGWLLFSLHSLWIPLKIVGSKVEGLRVI